MENQELDIPILSYLDGDMNAEEKNAFEISMSKNEILRQTVEEYKVITSGVKSYSKKQMKVDLLIAQASVIKANDLQNYKPSMNGSGGFSIFKFIVSILVLGSIVSAALIYYGKMPIKHELIEKVNEKLHSYDTLFEMKYDTVWTTISNEHLEVGDTVYIETQEEMDAFKGTLEGNEYEE